MPAKRKKPPAHATPSRPPEPRAAWAIHFFQRDREDDPAEAIPARRFLDSVPNKVAAMMVAVLRAVAEAPPPGFSGGGKWEAMHGEMAGVYEVRVDGPKREHFRLFCVLERNGTAVGLGGPSIVLVDGRAKPFKTTLSNADYAAVKALVREYARRTPRSVAR